MNACLRMDPESKLRLSRLQGRVITIELLPFHYIFQCQFTEAGVTLHANEPFPAEAALRGTPLNLLGVMLAKDHRHRFFAEDLVITGNAELGQQVIELFDELQIDWEEQLSHLTGDVPAYHVGRFIRGISEWLRRTEKTVAQDVNEFVHEETDWFPAREALQDFFNDIDGLRMDVDRMEARIIQLQGLISPTADYANKKNSEDEGSQ